MVARTPQKQRKVAMVVPILNSDLLKETINKVDKCMERLQELQYTIAGGTKVVSGVNLSPRSTRTYLKTSLRCKQETLRIKNATNKRSPIGKFPTSSPGDWRKMSLPAMLLGETVNEILQASQVTRDIVDSFAPKKIRNSTSSEEENGPKTPEIQQKTRKSKPETVNTNIKARRKKEKQNKKRSESNSPQSKQKARSRIVFKKIISPQKTTEQRNQNGENSFRHFANRVSPKHKPWVKKTILFPNPLFISGSSSTQQATFSRTMSPVISRSKNSKETPHKFLIKSPSKFQVKIKTPPKTSVSPPRNGSNLTRKSPRSSVSPRNEGNLTRKSPKVSVSPTRNGSNLTRKSPRSSVSPRNEGNLTRKSPRSSVSPRNGSNLSRKSPRGSVSPTRNGSNLTRKSPRGSISSISPLRNLPKKSPKLSTVAKFRRSFTPTRNGSNLSRKSSISPKRVTLQAFISPARNSYLGKKSPTKPLISPTRVGKKKTLSTAAKLRRSFSPSRLAMRLVSPLKSRRSVVEKCKDDEIEMMVSGLRQRPVLVPKRFSMGRI